MLCKDLMLHPNPLSVKSFNESQDIKTHPNQPITST